MKLVDNESLVHAYLRMESSEPSLYDVVFPFSPLFLVPEHLNDLVCSLQSPILARFLVIELCSGPLSILAFNEKGSSVK